MSAEDEARVWMESALGEKFEGSFCDALKSGERLVKLANRIKVNSIPKYNVNPTMPIKKSENITFFLKTIRSWGMTEYQMFETSDIDKGNLKPVVNCLHALGSLLQSKAEFESLDLPKLGIKAVGKNVSMNPNEFYISCIAIPHFGAHTCPSTSRSASSRTSRSTMQVQPFLYLIWGAPTWVRQPWPVQCLGRLSQWLVLYLLLPRHIRKDPLPPWEERGVP